MGLFDLFKKNKKTPIFERQSKRYWLLSNLATIELPESWEVSYIDRFQAKTPDEKTTLTIVNYIDNESVGEVNQAFFEDMKLDFYQEYENEGFTPIAEAYITDNYIGKSFSGENEIQYHFTTAKKEKEGILITEFLLQSKVEFQSDLQELLIKIGQSLEYVSNFTQLLAEKMKSEKNEINIISAENLEIKWSVADDIHTSFLDNAYAEYMHRPNELNEVLIKYATILIEEHLQKDEDSITENNHTEASTEYVFPVVKGKKFIESLDEMNLSDIIYESINDELYVVYVVENKGVLQYLTHFCLEEKDITLDVIKDISAENLVNKIEVGLQEEQNYFLLIADGSFETSFLLIPEVWTKQNFPVEGNIVVGIPSKEIFMITGSENIEGITIVKQKTEEIFENSEEKISNKLFELREGRFIPME